MKEWVLVIAMTLVNEPGLMNDVQMDTVDGFTSEAHCEAAAQKIAHTLLSQVRKYRKQMNVPRQDGAIDFPSVHTECLKVDK